MTIRKPRALTEEQAKKWLRRHLCYEIQMMRELYGRLLAGASSQFDRNTQIECYHLHCRNLIEFFKNKDPCDVDPRRFTNDAYKPDGNFINASLDAKINQQISHLTAKRTAERKKKLGPDQWKDIRDAIEKEIDRFEMALTDNVRPLWVEGLELMDFTPKLYASNCVASATNHVIIDAL